MGLFQRLWLVSFFFGITLFTLSAQTYIEYNDEIRQCYDKIISLKINDALVSIKQLKQNQTGNGAILHMENYIDFFVLFITENQAEYKRLQKNKNIRFEQLEKCSVSQNPYLNFIKAEILLQWALIELKFDEKLTAGSDVYTAYKLLEKNKSEFPDFIENNKSLSIIHALAESVPGWVRKIVGIKGSISLGSKEIELIANHALKDKDYFFREEVACIYTYILFYQLNQKGKAIDQLNKFNLDHQNIPLVTFLKASMYLRNGNNDECLNILNQLKSSGNQLPFYYLDFMKGKSLLFKQDAAAKKHLLVFVDNFKGKHFIKEAYQKLAWYELSINNDLAAYKKYMTLCTSKGSELVDEDKQAVKEAKTTKVPNAILLQSRILYDGGYYSRAQSVLIRNAHSLSDDKTTSLEFNYRMARILQSLKNYPDAIEYYKTTIALGQNSSEYCAASAALQMGIIYEEQKQLKAAKNYYALCLKLKPSEYRNSLHQKAKSGLERLK